MVLVVCIDGKSGDDVDFGDVLLLDVKAYNWICEAKLPIASNFECALVCNFLTTCSALYVNTFSISRLDMYRYTIVANVTQTITNDKIINDFNNSTA